jgi:RpiR family transcriptional regulator, carbohydrate utilization regulator
MKSPLDIISVRYNSLSNSEKKVADFVQKNAKDLVFLSTQALAKKCETSDASVIRFCRTLGFLGYQDFKRALVPELLSKGFSPHKEIEALKTSEKIKETFRTNLQRQLQATITNCNLEMVRKAASRIVKSSRIIIVGLGGSAGVGYIFCDALGSIGIQSYCLHDRSLIESQVPLLSSIDIIVGISHSGETEETVFALRRARQNNVFTLGITNFNPSPLSDESDILIHTCVADNLMGSYSCQPRISQLAVLEILLYEITQEIKKIGSNGSSKEKFNSRKRTFSKHSTV